MGKSLAEYAAENSQPLPELEQQQTQQAIECWRQEQQKRQGKTSNQEKADRLKGLILSDLEQAAAPQYVVYLALDAIGLLTNDPAWAERGKQYLDAIYEDLAQQSLTADNEAIATQRAAAAQIKYKERMRRQINSQLAGYKRIEKGLNQTLHALDDLEELEALEAEE